jgi:hypothetical protein
MPTYNLPLSELQTALFARLDSLLTVTVGDHIDEDTDFPYATIGEFVVTPNGTKTSGDVDVIGTIHIWSKYQGTKECQQIADTICASLTTNASYLELTGGYEVRYTALDRFSTVAEYNGNELIRHGTLDMRWYVTC